MYNITEVNNKARYVWFPKKLAFIEGSYTYFRLFFLANVFVIYIDGFHGAWLHFLRARVKVCV